MKTIENYVNNFLFVVCHHRISKNGDNLEKIVRENDLVIVSMSDEKLRPVFALVENVKKERSCEQPGDEGGMCEPKQPIKRRVWL